MAPLHGRSFWTPAKLWWASESCQVPTRGTFVSIDQFDTRRTTCPFGHCAGCCCCAIRTGPDGRRVCNFRPSTQCADRSCSHEPLFHDDTSIATVAVWCTCGTKPGNVSATVGAARSGESSAITSEFRITGTVVDKTTGEPVAHYRLMAALIPPVGANHGGSRFAVSQSHCLRRARSTRIFRNAPRSGVERLRQMTGATMASPISRTRKPRGACVRAGQWHVAD
jgi:hypothetical protein